MVASSLGGGREEALEFFNLEFYKHGDSSNNASNKMVERR
jgi:hypothetical protein